MQVPSMELPGAVGMTVGEVLESFSIASIVVTGERGHLYSIIYECQAVRTGSDCRLRI